MDLQNVKNLYNSALQTRQSDNLTKAKGVIEDKVVEAARNGKESVRINFDKLDCFSGVVRYVELHNIFKAVCNDFGLECKRWFYDGPGSEDEGVEISGWTD